MGNPMIFRQPAVASFHFGWKQPVRSLPAGDQMADLRRFSHSFISFIFLRRSR